MPPVKRYDDQISVPVSVRMKMDLERMADYYGESVSILVRRSILGMLRNFRTSHPEIGLQTAEDVPAIESR